MLSLPRGLPRWPLLAIPVALAACSGKPPAEQAAPRSTLPVYAVDLLGGAKLCTVPASLEVKDGATAETTMVIGNDGGWCGIAVAQAGPKPFDYALVASADRPAHGKVNVHAVGDNTRIDYTPDAGYVGPDLFTVQLRPGTARVKVTVTVQGVAQPASAVTPPPVVSHPATSGTRPATQRR